jgi:hypothetical protein
MGETAKRRIGEWAGSALAVKLQLKIDWGEALGSVINHDQR